MSLKKIVTCCFFLFSLFTLCAQQEQKKPDSAVAKVPKRIYVTKAVENLPSPVIDGILDDESWNLVAWQGDFIEWQPDENTPPSHQTQFKIVYDKKNLYVGIRAFDTEPEKIVKRLSRRDGFNGDWIEINFDSYHDLRTGFSFNITAAGVKGDEFISDNGHNWDASWNPIWYAKTNIDEEGWTAEMKIPLSQLRFGKAKEQVWGLQLNRRFFRAEERSLWQRVPQDAPGWVSEMGELHGLLNLEPQKQLEIQPFTVTQLETYPEEEGDPFRDGSDVRLNGGIDAKIGITNDLTLDLTVNPDFGQVEADPAAIALD
ncbi:MAG: carbohydrate binding family 9 domain-containing protein, partial [Sinomicrobium sp.]|nr:carbohydrate binding family 9 domain-containing protein [Sinomicrobium sp.]